MHFTAATLASVLLAAESVLAGPVPFTLVPRKPRANRRSNPSRTRPFSAASNAEADVTLSDGTKHVSYSSNWAGAVLIGTEYTSVTGTFIVPTPEEPSSSDSSASSTGTSTTGATVVTTTVTTVVSTSTSTSTGSGSGAGGFGAGGSGSPGSGAGYFSDFFGGKRSKRDSTQYSASAWVGLDGDTCATAILQTGVDFTVQDGEVSFDAWYEWYPDYAYTFDGFTISAGDEIRVTASASSTTSGSVTIENLTTDESVSHSFSGESDSLCETNAEWIVEDYESNGELVALADFGTVTFTNCSVTASGSSIGVDGATIIDIKQDGEVLTSCSTSGSDSVECTYV